MLGANMQRCETCGQEWWLNHTCQLKITAATPLVARRMLMMGGATDGARDAEITRLRAAYKYSEAHAARLLAERDAMRALLAEWDEGLYDGRDFLQRVRLLLHGDAGLQAVPVGPNV